MPEAAQTHEVLAPKLPLRLGRFVLCEELGAGGMATVFLARMQLAAGLERLVALKTIHRHLAKQQSFVDMFLDEARIAAGINHANVAQVFELGKEDNTYWIAMEYLHGEPLREIMRRVEDKRAMIPFHVAARVCADAGTDRLFYAAHSISGVAALHLGTAHGHAPWRDLILFEPPVMIGAEHPLHALSKSDTIKRSQGTARRRADWDSPAARISSPARSPAAGSSALRSPVACCTDRSSCCSTSRPPASTRMRGASSGSAPTRWRNPASPCW